MVIDERKVNLAEWGASCIKHPDNEPMVIVSGSLLDLCRGNRSAMEIAGIFCLCDSGWLSLSTPATFTEIAEHCLLFTSRSAIQDGLDVLVKEMLVSRTSYTGQDAVKILLEKKGQSVKGSGKVCGWCKGTTYALELHHYPIPQSEGGQTTVKICGSCHREYHYLTDNSFYSPTPKLLSAIEL